MKVLKFKPVITIGAGIGTFSGSINIHLVNELGRKIDGTNLINIRPGRASRVCGNVNESAAQEVGIKLNAYTNNMVVETGSPN